MSCKMRFEGSKRSEVINGPIKRTNAIVVKYYHYYYYYRYYCAHSKSSLLFCAAEMRIFNVILRYQCNFLLLIYTHKHVYNIYISN